MICDFLASFRRREDKRPTPAKSRGHTSDTLAHRDRSTVGPTPGGVLRPTRRETLP